MQLLHTLQCAISLLCVNKMCQFEIAISKLYIDKILVRDDMSACCVILVSGASILTGFVFECNIAHFRPVAQFPMQHKMNCNQMYPHYGALPVQYVPVRVTHGTLVVDRYTYELPRCRTSQNFNVVF